MTFPAGSVPTAHLDSGGDDPALARADILDLAQQFNALVAHFSTQAKSLIALPSLIPGQALNAGMSFAVASNALTITMKDGAGSTIDSSHPVVLPFRSSTLATGQHSVVVATSVAALVISSGSTLGCLSGVDAWLHLYALNNSGTIELAVSGVYYGKSFIGSTTAEGGAGAADSGSAIYSATARSNVSMVHIGSFRSNQATAGTWTATPVESIIGAAGPEAVVAFTHNGGISQGATGLNELSGYSTASTALLKNVGGCFNASTGRFTAPYAGMGVFAWSCQTNGLASGGTPVTFLRKNGGTPNLGRASLLTNTAGNFSAGGTMLLPLAAGDYVSVWGSSSGYVTGTDYFWGHMLPIS